MRSFLKKVKVRSKVNRRVAVFPTILLLILMWFNAGCGNREQKSFNVNVDSALVGALKLPEGPIQLDPNFYLSIGDYRTAALFYSLALQNAGAQFPMGRAKISGTTTRFEDLGPTDNVCFNLLGKEFCMTKEQAQLGALYTSWALMQSTKDWEEFSRGLFNGNYYDFYRLFYDSECTLLDYILMGKYFSD